MKKLIMTAAMGFAASIVSAQVYSQNVVGYAKNVTPEAGSVNILNVNVFGTADIQDAIANLDDLNAATSGNLASADKIYVWTGSGYATYGLYDAGSSNYWMNVLDAGWNKASKAAPSSVNLERGQSVWYQTGAGGSAADLMTAGEVPNDGAYDVDVGSVSLVSYPYSSAINLTDLVVSNGTAATSGNLGLADKLYVWSGSGYTTYGYYNAGASNYWMNVLDAGWNKSSKAAPSSLDIDLGQGVWYQSADGAKTIGFSQNYNLD